MKRFILKFAYKNSHTKDKNHSKLKFIIHYLELFISSFQW